MDNIHLYVIKNDIAMVSHLLNKNNVKARYKISPIVVALVINNMNIVNLLMSFSVSFTNSSSRIKHVDYLLMVACLNNNYDDCKKYLQLGANPNTVQALKLSHICGARNDSYAILNMIDELEQI